MTTCERHCRPNCRSCIDESQRRGTSTYYGDNAGAVGINTDGNLSLGLGSGLSIDLDDGSIGFGGSGGFGGFDT